jgi:hypothetical protein
MVEWNSILSALVFGLFALGAYLVVLVRKSIEVAVKTTAEETAKATIQQLRWPAELAQELQKTRGVERQELRFKSYGALWKELRPLAIYDETVINKEVTACLSSKLTNWYFSESGGLLLTSQTRDFYFALQDLLRATSKFPENWEAERLEASKGAERFILETVLKARRAEGAISTLEYFSKDVFENWHYDAAELAKKWREGINNVAAAWNELDKRQRFSTLQQAGSVLRTALVNDLESRVR